MENKSHGLWAVTAGKAPELPVFEGESQSDVAVIGGGYTGLSAALYIAQNNCTVTLLEANQIGFGGAGRNVGLVNAGLWLMPEQVIKIAGPEYGERLLTELGGSPELVFNLIKEHAIECEALRNGTLHCAHSASGFRALVQRETQWKERGAPVKLLNKADAAHYIGSRAFHGALLDLRAGTIQPLAYAYGLAKAARKAGASIFMKSPVISIQRKGDRYEVCTTRGTLKAKAIILACQGYAQDGFEQDKKELIPFNFFQFSTRPLPEKMLKTILPQKQGAWDTALVLSSYRLDIQGRLLVGSVGNLEGMAEPLHKNWARRTIQKVFPQAESFKLEHGWYGTIAMTIDHIPRFHKMGPDFITVTNYNGRGIGPGTYFGKIMARYLLEDNKNIIPLPETSQKSIWTRGLRGFFYETGARLYHLIQKRF